MNLLCSVVLSYPKPSKKKKKILSEPKYWKHFSKAMFSKGYAFIKLFEEKKIVN